jgi:hypothetical protein
MRASDSLPTASTDLTAAIPAVDRRGLAAASASANRNGPDVLPALTRPLARQAAAAASALADSAECSGEYGKVTLDHDTLICTNLGIPNYQAHEIGRPLEVWWRNKKKNQEDGSPCWRRAGRQEGQYVLVVARRLHSASAVVGMSAAYQIAGVERRPSIPNAGPADRILRGGIHPAGNPTTHAVLLALARRAESFSIKLGTALCRGLAGKSRAFGAPDIWPPAKRIQPALRVVTVYWCHERPRQDQSQRGLFEPIAKPAKARNQQTTPVSRSASANVMLLALARLLEREAARETLRFRLSKSPLHKESIR